MSRLCQGFSATAEIDLAATAISHFDAAQTQHFFKYISMYCVDHVDQCLRQRLKLYILSKPQLVHADERV